MDRLVIDTVGDYDICGFGLPYCITGGCFDSGYVSIEPIMLVPEGGVCRVETTRRRQRCVSCGQMSWRDETITCPGCQSQVFEEV